MADDLNTDPIPASSKVPGLEGLDYPRYPAFLTAVYNKVNKGYSPIIAICGQMGKGKSMTAAKIMEYLHNEVNLLKGEVDEDQLRENVVYGTLDFLKAIEGRERQAITMEESGTTLSKNTYNSMFNRTVDETIQTMRIKENVYIIVIPKLSDLDPDIQDHVDFILLVEDPGKVKVTARRHQYDRTDGKNVRYINLGYWLHGLPSDELVDAYNEMDREWKEGNLKKNIERIEQKKKEEEGQRRTGDAADLF